MARLIKVIPCLDVKDGRVVKGVRFQNLRDAGDPAELAHVYSTSGADEVALLDLSASNEGRSTMLDVVAAAAARCRVPLTVGGGISSASQANALIELGAARVSVSTAAVTDPALIDAIAKRCGSDAVVLSLDARRTGNSDDGYPGFEVTTHGGTRGTGIDAVDWVREAERRGAGTILVNSIDQDGVRGGFDLELIQQVRDAVTIPIIASGGAGTVEHFVEGAVAGADAVLGASVFHFGIVKILEVKEALLRAGFAVELPE